MSRSIIIDVKRDDGQVTRLEGRSGIAVVSPPLDDDVATTDAPMVSVRCSTEAEMAWNLAGILAAVKSQSFTAYVMAHELEGFLDTKSPIIQHKLPDWKKDE